MIHQTLLNDIAQLVDGKIKKVVINEMYEITDFVVKQVTESVIALNYIIPVSVISLVELIELKDENNQILSSNTVQVPIAADHMMLQTISVKGR